MKIKRFTARSMPEALQMVKAELGPDAIILSARSIKKNGLFLDPFRKAEVEVTAAQDTPSIAPYTQSARTRGASRGPVLSMNGKRARTAVEMQADSAADDDDARAFGDRRLSDRAGRDRTLRESWLYRHLIGQDVRREYALEMTSELLADSAAEKFGDEQLVTALARALRKMGADTRPMISAGARTVAFVGPSGVGKTVCAAKLAAFQAVDPDRRVAIITLDDYRVASADQLQRCAELIGIPLFAAAQPEQLRLALRGLQSFDLVLVDTPALRPADGGMIQKLSDDLKLVQAEEVHLVCSATAKEKDTIALLKALKSVPVNRLLFTKLDETASYGSLVNLLVRLQIPASGFSEGQQIPDSLQEAAVEKLAGLMLNHSGGQPAKCTAGVKHGKHPASAFTANKNSCLFHTADCMWTRLIKRENRIFFHSADEALQRKFKPCRDCCRKIAAHPALRRWG